MPNLSKLTSQNLRGVRTIVCPENFVSKGINLVTASQGLERMS